jgi:hypothetical protein
MVSEVGLNGPPPPKIVMVAVPMGLQLGPGEGLGLADGLGLAEGEGLGLGDADGLGLGDGEGLGPACVTVVPTLRSIALTVRTAQRANRGCFANRVCGCAA